MSNAPLHPPPRSLRFTRWSEISLLRPWTTIFCEWISIYLQLFFYSLWFLCIHLELSISLDRRFFYIYDCHPSVIVGLSIDSFSSVKNICSLWFHLINRLWLFQYSSIVWDFIFFLYLFLLGNGLCELTGFQWLSLCIKRQRAA